VTLNGLLALLAVIVLVIAAVLFFFADDVELRTVLGIMCLGLAAGWASRFEWPNRP
jgi:hypothetical protein